MLDELRRRFPELGFALYAMEPGRPVTLEIYSPEGDVFPFVAHTVEAAVLKAFPPPPPALKPVPKAEAVATLTALPEPSVFD